MTTLSDLAASVVDKYPDSDLEIAYDFFQSTLPSFITTSNDRLVKVGRSLRNLVDMQRTGEINCLETSVQLLLEECALLLTDGEIRVPRVTFGKTGLDISIVTLGCMRFQQEWGPRITHMNQVDSDCQDNLVAILKQAHTYGINHIETAAGYGSSELQIGAALKQLAFTNQSQRDEWIIQTKIGPNPNSMEFRNTLEKSFAKLQVDYLDLFSFHGINVVEQVEWVFGPTKEMTNESPEGLAKKQKGQNEEIITTPVETNWDVIQEYVTAGKIKHVGFTSHGSVELIRTLIEKDVFEYANVHYHYFGSYTASGNGPDTRGNYHNIKLMTEKNMGIFIISPFDKGGRLYGPSRQLRALTLPEMEPMTFGANWIWNHHRLGGDQEGLQIHTYTAGAGRPSDLDQSAVAAYLHGSKGDDTLAKLTAVVDRLEDAKQKVLGKEWVQNWSTGLPKAQNSKHLVEHNQIVWLYNLIKAFGMYDFALNRYKAFENNSSKWDDRLTPDENLDKNVGRNAWGWVPGLPLKEGVDYFSDDLKGVPEENKARVKDAQTLVLKWLATTKDPTKSKTDESAARETMPKSWETAIDMRPWPDFPDRPSRAPTSSS